MTFSKEVVDPNTNNTPQIIFENTRIDFGVVQEGQEVEGSFTFKNIGNEVLKIDKITSGCGCTKATVSSEQLPPKSYGVIDVKFDTSNNDGEQEREVFVWVNDPLNSIIRLVLHGKIVRLIDYQPRILDFGNIYKNQILSKEIQISYLNDNQAVIKKVGCNSECIRADIKDEVNGRFILTGLFI
jgi:hypothetical protein